MTKYHTINLDKKYYNALEKFIQDRDDYTNVKQFLKESANQKRTKLENQEKDQLLQALDTILKNTDITRQEITEMIKNKD